MTNNTTPPNPWWLEGLIWGFIMFLGLGVFFPLIMGERLFLKNIMLQIVLWAVAGLVYGWITKGAKIKDKN